MRRTLKDARPRPLAVFEAFAAFGAAPLQVGDAVTITRNPHQKLSKKAIRRSA